MSLFMSYASKTDIELLDDKISEVVQGFARERELRLRMDSDYNTNIIRIRIVDGSERDNA